jgi:hypothetical protein
MASVNPCAITNVLANDYANAITLINRKFNALRRLAELLEQLGDISGLLAGLNPSALIPLYLINLDTYTNLVTACPFLNLPKTPSNASTAALQAQVGLAYSRLLQSLNLHPFIRMDKLQAQMDKVQGPLNEILNTGSQYMQCLQQACASATDAVNFVNKIAQTDFQGQLDDYTRTYLANNGKVLTQQMQHKVSEVRGLVDNVNEALSTAPLTSPSLTPLVPQVPIPTNHPVPPPPSGPVT